MPKECLDALQLYAVAEIQFEDVQASTTNTFIYVVKFALGDVVIPRQEIVLTGLEFVIVGRDVLQYFDLHLYGKEQKFELMLA